VGRTVEWGGGGFCVLFPSPVYSSVVLPLDHLLSSVSPQARLLLWVVPFLSTLGSGRLFLLDLDFSHLPLCCLLYQLQGVIASILPTYLCQAYPLGFLFALHAALLTSVGFLYLLASFFSVALFVHGAVSILLPSRVIGQVCQRSFKNKLFATVPDSSINSWESCFIFNLRKINKS
jgi:hypothetical protein